MTSQPERRPRCTAPGCGVPQHNGLLCTGCAEGLDTDLLEVLEVWPDLLITRTRQDCLGDPTSGSSARPLPWNEQASHAMSRLAGAVRALDALAGPLTACEVACHRCVAQIGAEGSNPDPAPLARWLWTQRPELVLRSGIGPAAARLDHALDAARHAIDLPEYDRRFPVGPCPQPGQRAAYCTGTVLALIPTREADPTLMRCSDCDHVWTSGQFMRAGRMIHTRMRQLGLVTERLTRRRALISRDTLRRLSGRAQSVITKHCVPVDLDPLTRTPLYDAEQAMATLARVGTRARTTRCSA
jgi:hypothetical protein